MKNKIIAFICGDITVTLTQITGNIWNELGLFGVKIIATLILGVAGGVAGLVGKDLFYPYILKIINKLKNKKP